VRIYLLVGQPEKALDELEPLLKIPYYLSPGWLRIDPTFAPLKGNPAVRAADRGEVAHLAGAEPRAVSGPTYGEQRMRSGLRNLWSAVSDHHAGVELEGQLCTLTIAPKTERHLVRSLTKQAKHSAADTRISEWHLRHVSSCLHIRTAVFASGARRSPVTRAGVLPSAAIQ